jgi:guanylate kinase
MGDRRAMSPRLPVLVIVGPSASGKSSAVRQLADRGAVQVHPTWTTRPRRTDEAEGSLEHRFVTDDEFDGLDASGFFLDTVAMFGLPHRYGLPPLGNHDRPPVHAVMLRAPLVERFVATVDADLLVYQIEDTGERTSRRLAQRGCDVDELAARLRDNEQEIVLGRHVADRVFVNAGPLDATVDAIVSALRCDLQRTAA